MLGDLFSKLQEARQMMEGAKQKLAENKFTIQVENGLIQIEASADKRIHSIKIDKKLLTEPDALEDLLVVAINKVMDKSEEIASGEIKGFANGLIPGLF